MQVITHRLRLALSTLIVAALTACAATSTRESTGEYLDDTTITTRVKAELIAHKDVSAADINVETFKGRVQLSGFAKSAEERRKAVDLARSVKGVSEVVNDIRLR